jgi:hypothetical protein
MTLAEGIPIPKIEILKKPNSVRVYLGISALLFWLALGQFRDQITIEGLVETSRNFRFAFQAGNVSLAILLIFLGISFTSRWAALERSLQKLAKLFSSLRIIVYAAAPVIVVAYIYVLLGFYGRFFLETYTRFALFGASASLLALALSLAMGKNVWSTFALSILGLAVIHNAALFLQEVNAYPLSLGWSEISRYYQASFFAPQSLYGLDLAWPITHPSRYLLQSLPFQIEDSQLWMHRLWQAFLWISMAGITAWTYVRRLNIKRSWFALALGLYIYLFLMQGAVFYHLLPCVFIVLLTFDPKRFARSLAFVILASIWAGISRINWVPLPGALAVLLYVLESPLDQKESPLSLRYWFQPVTYFLIGSLTALASYWLYIQNSGVEDLGQFSSSFTSDLLWQRLWPNNAFPLGILPGILLVSLPLMLVVIAARDKQTMKRVRWLAIITALLAFFAGGLVVSVKIGGGTNLHNLDAYMVLLLTLGLYFVFGKTQQENPAAKQVQPKLHWSHVLLLILIPVFFAVSAGSPIEEPDPVLVEEAIQLIQDETQYYLDLGMEVLFISQRHLITFKMIEAPLVHEYEKLFLMEMAISQNDPYLLQFHDDIHNWRFGLIVTDPLHRFIREEDQNSLAAENNEWVRFVSRPILCDYRVIETYPELGLQLLVPRFGNPCEQ